MPELKQQFKELDTLPVPDLKHRIRARLQRLQEAESLETSAGRAWRRVERQQRLTGRASQLLAAVAIVALAAGLALIYHYARTTGPVTQPRPPAISPSPTIPAPPVNILPAPPGNRVVFYHSFFSANDAAAQVQPAGELLITHDGGRTWIKTGVKHAYIRVMWLDSNHLVVAWDEAPYPGGVQVSSDGGYHWQAVGQAGGETNNTYFLNTSEGWAASCQECGQGSTSPQTTIMHTTDSGAHWQQLGTPLSWPGIWPMGLYFVDSAHGFMSVSSNGAARLLVTRDGGRTWRLVDLPTPPGGWHAAPSGAPVGCDAGTCTLLPAMFGKRGVLLVEGAGVYPWFSYSSSDGGLTWGNPHSFPVHVPQPVAIPWQAPLDPNNWWMAENGFIFRTNDGGSNWHLERRWVKGEYSLAYIKPVGGDVLWGTATSAQGSDVLVRSTDGGATWAVISESN